MQTELKTLMNRIAANLFFCVLFCTTVFAVVPDGVTKDSHPCDGGTRPAVAGTSNNDVQKV